MAPENRIARGRTRRLHVSKLRLVGELYEVRIGAARKVVNQVVDVLDCSKKVVAVGPTAKAKKALNLQDALDVFRSRVSLKDEIGVSTGPAIPVPQWVRALEFAQNEIVPHFFTVSEFCFQI